MPRQALHNPTGQYYPKTTAPPQILTRHPPLPGIPLNKKMKTLLLLTLIFAAFGDALFAQPSQPKIFSVSVRTLDRRITYGYLYDITDTTLLLSSEKSLLRLTDTLPGAGIRSFRVSEVNRVSVYKKGGIGRSALTGLLIGAGTFALVGLASGDDPRENWFAFTAGEKAFAGAVFGGGAGLLVGFIVGVIGHKNFYIGGKQKRYEQMRQRTLARMGL